MINMKTYREVIDEPLVCPDCGYSNHPDEVDVRQDFIDPQVDNYYCAHCDYPVGNSKANRDFILMKKDCMDNTGCHPASVQDCKKCGRYKNF